MSQKDANFGGHKVMPSLPKASRSGLQCEAGRLWVFQASFCRATQPSHFTGVGTTFFLEGLEYSLVFLGFFGTNKKSQQRF